ncbi:MAG: hypothetical protein ACLP5H_13425 [Desulfomonilaceae bacterium]
MAPTRCHRSRRRSESVPSSSRGEKEMAKRRLLAVVGAGEAFTGLALVLYPSLVVRLLFGAGISGAGTVMSRIAGIALIALGVACWPGPPLVGMMIYSALAMAYLTYVGISGEWVGPLLWPAVGLHVVLTLLLARAWLKARMEA